MTFEINPVLEKYVENEIIPGTGVEYSKWKASLFEILKELVPVNEQLLEERATIQNKISEWHKINPITADWNPKTVDYQSKYKSFLTEIGYLVPEGDDFEITTENIDREIALVPGPQLVVPINNPRFALNAANARWGSLFDACYGTDIVPDEGETAKTKDGKLNPARAGKVFEFVDVSVFDKAIPLASGKSHQIVKSYSVNAETHKLTITLEDGSEDQLKDLEKFVGYTENTILFVNNELHIELVTDSTGGNDIAKLHHASLKDVIIESAMSAILDCEDSVAAVDAEDKVKAYGVWNEMNKGTLTCTFQKGGKEIKRALHKDKSWTSHSGGTYSLPGRVLMLVRNVGIHMTTNAVLMDGKEIPEGILDAMVTVLGAKHDLLKSPDSEYKNTKNGSIYIVKPKMHGPKEVAFTANLFSKVEEALNIPENTIKVGIMDEERRTSANLKECIRQAKDRLVFINTGFLDRTGDEIHTSNEAGIMHLKSEIKQQKWLNAYENNNVDVGLETGLPGKAQIGKGMWARPDSMRAMINEKIGHPKSGANCSWVPSPTAATLHATHYHTVSVHEIQKNIAATRKRTDLTDLLTPPITPLGHKFNEKDIDNELRNNIQGILGYVVRWIDQGIGCSKVPNINGVGLMEDRATLRISSQHVANWIYQKVVTKEKVEAIFKEMAVIVDEQNKNDTKYTKMSTDFDNNIAFAASQDLVFKGLDVMNGYTEPFLTQRRREFKAKNK